MKEAIAIVNKDFDRAHRKTEALLEVVEPCSEVNVSEAWAQDSASENRGAFVLTGTG